MIQKRQLGKTGHNVSIFSLGGEATLQRPERAAEAEALINRALDLGVNYIDTSPIYNSGGSENNIGRVMAYRRQDVFLATKTGERSYDGTMRLIEQSLARLQTDYLNLYQLHDLQTEADLKQIFGADGAIKALEKLKQEGVIQHLGVTGHKDPAILFQAITTYTFDCLLMSFNAGDVHHRSCKKDLLPEAVKQNLGIITMKVTAVGKIFRQGGISSMDQALGYVLSHPVSTAIVGITTSEELEENVRIATDFKPYSEPELAELEALTADYADDANFFKHQW